MKKLILAAIAASFAVSAAPAYAGDHFVSANVYNNAGQRWDPAYNRDRLIYGGYNSYPLPLIPYYPNVVKQNTARRGGEWFKACGDDPAVPIHEDCSQRSDNQSVPQGQQMAVRSYYIDGDHLYEESNQAAQSTPAAQAGYWDWDVRKGKSVKCFFTPNGEHGNTELCPVN